MPALTLNGRPTLYVTEGHAGAAVCWLDRGCREHFSTEFHGVGETLTADGVTYRIERVEAPPISGSSRDHSTTAGFALEGV